jgi:hypothetical protein
MMPVVIGQHSVPRIKRKCPQAQSSYPAVEDGIQGNRAVHGVMSGNE